MNNVRGETYTSMASKLDQLDSWKVYVIQEQVCVK